MDIQFFFRVRKVEMSDGCDLYELVTPDGERVASATRPEPMDKLEMELNLALTSEAERDTDVVVNA